MAGVKEIRQQPGCSSVASIRYQLQLRAITGNYGDSQLGNYGDSALNTHTDPSKKATVN
jgi:hypothetical protein